MKNNFVTCGLIVGAVLMGFSSSGWARATGATVSKSSYNVEAWTDSEATALYWRSNIGDGTKWEWKWSKVYPQFTTYCSAAKGQTCNASHSQTKTEQVARMWGVTVTPTGSQVLQEATKRTLQLALAPVFQKTFTESLATQFTWNMNLTDGWNAYGGIISLERTQKNARILGLWERVSCRKVDVPQKGKIEICDYRWDDEKQSGSWNGKKALFHRTFMCSTRTVTEHKVGKNVPAGCSTPDMPKGFYGD